MFSDSDFRTFVKKTAENIWEKLKSKLQIFGNFFSVLIGIIVIIRFVKFFLNMIINSVLYKDIGCDWKLCFFWWENMVHHILLRKRTTDDLSKYKDDKTHSKNREVKLMKQEEIKCNNRTNKTENEEEHKFTTIT